jgi:hypothetical protein
MKRTIDSYFKATDVVSSQNAKEKAICSPSAQLTELKQTELTSIKSSNLHSVKSTGKKRT